MLPGILLCSHVPKFVSSFGISAGGLPLLDWLGKYHFSNKISEATFGSTQTLLGRMAKLSGVLWFERIDCACSRVSCLFSLRSSKQRGIFGQIVTDRPCCKMSAIHCKGAHIWQVSVYIFLHLQVGVKSATPADIIRKTLQEWKKHSRVIVVLTFLIFNWGGEACICVEVSWKHKSRTKSFFKPHLLFKISSDFPLLLIYKRNMWLFAKIDEYLVKGDL